MFIEWHTKNQMLYVCNESSWWWAQYCSKHVEEVDKYNKQMVHQVGTWNQTCTYVQIPHKICKLYLPTRYNSIPPVWTRSLRITCIEADASIQAPDEIYRTANMCLNKITVVQVWCQKVVDLCWSDVYSLEFMLARYVHSRIYVGQMCTV